MSTATESVTQVSIVKKTYPLRASNEEMELFLSTLRQATQDQEQLHQGKIHFEGLPIEEWAGPAYAIAALYDPYVLTAELNPSIVYLEGGLEALAGINVIEKRSSQKEQIRFRKSYSQGAELFMPKVWGGVDYFRVSATADWRVLAHVAEMPGLLVKPGTAAFTFNPLRVMHRYQSMLNPSNLANLTDLLIQAIFGASSTECNLDDDPLRRDFHALGVNALLLNQMCRIANVGWDIDDYAGNLHAAARHYVAGEKDKAETLLGKIFRSFAQKRDEIVKKPVYIILMPHGGILFEQEGFAEYDSPEMAARALNLFMDWSETCGCKFAPDISAGTLEELAKLYPQTIERFKSGWEAGRLELVNGTFSQPYIQLWHMWDQDKQFELGLKTFTKIFGRRPDVYVAQEIALHPTLPDLLKKHGYTAAIHRAQNLGEAPTDAASLIDWTAPSGASIRTLPTHPLHSETRGLEIWRHFPVMQTSARNDGVPFLAFTSTMDQTFFDMYMEDVIRANRYAPVWGEFVTPSEFFRKTAEIKAEPRSYELDQYSYYLTIPSAGFHAPQQGGYSSQHAFVFAESARLQEKERQGALNDKELALLLNQEAHDSYIIPYFTTGSFMENLLTEYSGPTTHWSSDAPRGVTRFIRDVVGYPQSFADTAPATPEACEWNGAVLSAGDVSASIDPATGVVNAIGTLGGKAVTLGQMCYDGSSFTVTQAAFAKNRLLLTGTLAGFGRLRLEYFIASGKLYCEAAVIEQSRQWRFDKIAWKDCVYLRHQKPEDVSVIRNVGDLRQKTAIDIFHSLDEVTLQSAAQTVRLCHGGNIFFRQDSSSLQNRLWAYDEFCATFWWAVDLS